MIGIYLMVFSDGMQYIGQSIDIQKRIKQHISNRDGESKLSKHLQNYDFKAYIVEECPEEELDDRETYYIAKYNTYHNGLNSTMGNGSLTKIKGPGWFSLYRTDGKIDIRYSSDIGVHLRNIFREEKYTLEDFQRVVVHPCESIEDAKIEMYEFWESNKENAYTYFHSGFIPVREQKINKKFIKAQNHTIQPQKKEIKVENKREKLGF